jgi:hypothetical protein
VILLMIIDLMQEAKKTELSDTTLNFFNSHMDWKYMPAKGSAWGILVGFKSSTFEVISWQCFDYCVTVVVKNQADKFVWMLVVVYGSPYEETKIDFVNELHMVMGLWQGPTLAGG